MYSYILTGKIYPERVDFTVSSDIPLYLEHQEFNIKGNLTLQIKHSHINLRFDSEVVYSNSDTSPLETLKNILDQSIRTVVDAYCYVKSYAYDVEITDITCEQLGLKYQFGVQGEWNLNKDQQKTNEEFSRILNLFSVPDNSSFSDVLADFRRSVKYPVMTASFCFRAIETIRRSVFQDSWEVLRSELSLSQKDFVEILKFAKPNRHGQYPRITYEERERIMNFTRMVIDRTIDWLYARPQSNLT
jgi:hypothetical protein